MWTYVTDMKHQTENKPNSWNLVLSALCKKMDVSGLGGYWETNKVAFGKLRKCFTNYAAAETAVKGAKGEVVKMVGKDCLTAEELSFITDRLLKRGDLTSIELAWFFLFNWNLISRKLETVKINIGGLSWNLDTLLVQFIAPSKTDAEARRSKHQFHVYGNFLRPHLDAVLMLALFFLIKMPDFQSGSLFTEQFIADEEEADDDKDVEFETDSSGTIASVPPYLLIFFILFYFILIFNFF